MIQDEYSTLKYTYLRRGVTSIQKVFKSIQTPKMKTSRNVEFSTFPGCHRAEKEGFEPSRHSKTLIFIRV